MEQYLRKDLGHTLSWYFIIKRSLKSLLAVRPEKVTRRKKRKKKKKNPQTQKTIWKFFKYKALQIIIKCDLKIVDYLVVTLNLNDGTYRPFHKPNEETTYIHVKSDHPPQIIKKIPRSIEKRLSRLAPTKEIFENSVISKYRHQNKYMLRALASNIQNPDVI